MEKVSPELAAELAEEVYTVRDNFQMNVFLARPDIGPHGDGGREGNPATRGITENCCFALEPLRYYQRPLATRVVTLHGNR